MSATQIRLSKDDGWWIATDTEVDVTTQAKSREEALEKLDEAVALHRGEIGHEPSDEELVELGIDPTRNQSGDISESRIFE